ncbi:hypothetical protein SEA_XKCD426_39 [Streptomyces phage Xkcd426]|nr:hypothetical protein SEA_XKCD426_39 [Streptomyces phage Xkcd426]
MIKERSTYRHPKHDAIAALVTAGVKDNAVAAQLGVNRRAVARVRDILGLRANTNSTTKEAKLAKFAVGPNADGHTGWTGRTATSGAPVIRHLRVEMPASHVAFEQRTGRPPVGIVKAECGQHDCLTPSHISDELERRAVRMQERALHGLDPQPWDVCSKGLHTWDESGRIQPDLTPYCCTCNTERAARVRKAKKQEATA